MSNTVPEGWSVGALADFSDINPRLVQRPALDADTPVSFIKMEDVSNNAVVKNIRIATYAQVAKGFTAFQDHDVLVAKITPCFENGKGGFVKGLKNGVGFGSTEFHVLRARKNSDSKFVYQFTNSQDFRLKGESNMTGSAGQRRVPTEYLKTLDVAFPPLSEQQKIAAILSSVDDVIEKTRAQIDKLKDLKTGMMQELLTKGIGHTEFKDSPVGRIPASWKIQSLTSLCRRITDGTHQSVKTSDSGKIPFLYVSCIRNGEILWDKASGLTESDYKLASKGRVASPGDILYTAVGSYGHAALVETNQRFSFQRHIAFIQPDKSTVDPRYLVSMLNSTLGRTQADRFAIGNAQLTVTLGDLGTFMIPAPPIDEQHKIAKAISLIINNIREHETKLDSLLNLKTALMQDLLTGKVRVKAKKEALSHVE